MHFASPPSRGIHRRWGILAGFLGGILGGSIGANGPPVIMYLNMQPWHRDRIKSTMTTYFLCASIFNSSSHAIGGLITMDVLKGFAVALPATCLGIAAGVFCYKRISDVVYRKLALTLVFILGITMTVKGLF